MKPLKDKVSVTLDNDITPLLRELAADDDRSFSQYINRVLRAHVKTLYPNLTSSCEDRDAILSRQTSSFSRPM